MFHSLSTAVDPNSVFISLCLANISKNQCRCLISRTPSKTTTYEKHKKTGNNVVRNCERQTQIPQTNGASSNCSVRNKAQTQNHTQQDTLSCTKQLSNTNTHSSPLSPCCVSHLCVCVGVYGVSVSVCLCVLLVNRVSHLCLLFAEFFTIGDIFS